MVIRECKSLVANHLANPRSSQRSFLQTFNVNRLGPTKHAENGSFSGCPHVFFPGMNVNIYIYIYVYVKIYTLSFQTYKYNQHKINDIKKIHSFKADPNISVI